MLQAGRCVAFVFQVRLNPRHETAYLVILLCRYMTLDRYPNTFLITVQGSIWSTPARWTVKRMFPALFPPHVTSNSKAYPRVGSSVVQVMADVEAEAHDLSSQTLSGRAQAQGNLSTAAAVKVPRWLGGSR
jgi:hypothetical protein